MFAFSSNLCVKVTQDDDIRRTIAQKTSRKEGSCRKTFVSHSVGLELALFSILALCSGASGEKRSRGRVYPVITARDVELSGIVALVRSKPYDPALAAKLHTLLTTPFINNEAYFAGTKPLRPDLKSMGPSLRVVEWNIERGIEFDKIKLLLTDKQGFITEVHSEAASDTNPEKAKTRYYSTRWTCFSRQTCWYSTRSTGA